MKTVTEEKTKNEQHQRLHKEFVEQYAERERHGEHPLLQAYNGLGYVVYKRTYARPVYSGSEVERTEEWHETLERVVNGAQAIGAGLTDLEMERLYDHMWNLRGFVGGRMLWQLGTENNERLGGDSLVNCWYTELASVDDFIWMFHRLMLGGGVGFSVENGDKLGVVGHGSATLAEGFDVDFIVPDNREGWGELLERTMYAYFMGEDFTYSTDAVRPEGAPIKTFGGKASGPGELVDGVDKIQDVLKGAYGRTLNSVEMLDISNIIGAIVVSGNVRRSAQIAIGSAQDADYMQAKRWDLGGIPNFRAMSNNSVNVDKFSDVPDSFWEGYHGNGEAYGLVNTYAAMKYGRQGEVNYDETIAGFNPCAEIPLANRESCNLAEIVLPNIEGKAQLMDLAFLLYKVQKAVAAMPYLDSESDYITSKNLRLGLGVTGVMQSTQEQRSWLDPTYQALKQFDRMWSQERALPVSKRLTTVKPSGTLSILAGVTPGGHPGFSKYHIRRVRMSANDPILEWCQNRGYKWEWQKGFDGEVDTKTAVVEFPVELPEGTVLADRADAISQLQAQAYLQTMWADNAVSITVYYTLEELETIKEYLSIHWDNIKSVSFLLKDDHGFEQAPMEAIDEEQYQHLLSKVQDVSNLAHGAGISELMDSDCVSGACPVR